MEEFMCGTRILSGKGSLKALGELGAKRLLVVTDPYFYKNGWAEKAAQLAKAEAVEYFYGVQPDPSVVLAAEATALMKAFSPDVVVALGGGSTIDCAKAMVYFSGGGRLVAVPTTSGSGSEVTDFAILTHEGVKHPLVDPSLQPEMAVLDGELLQQLPPALVADGGFDAISHAVEAYAAAGSSAFTDALAYDAFAALCALLPKSYGGETAVRQRIHEASCMAGLAFTRAGLGLCHALAHSLGGAFHVPHGRLNAILLPEVIGCNACVAAERYGNLAAAIGCGSSARTLGVRNLKNALTQLRRQLDLPENLAQAGIPPAQLRQKKRAIIQAALADPCCATNPVKPEAAMVEEILQAVMGRG